MLNSTTFPFLFLIVITVTKRAKAAGPLEGPSSPLPCAASGGPEHALLPAESGHAHPASHPHGPFLERVLHQWQGSFQSHDGQRPQPPRILRPAEVRQLERLSARDPSWKVQLHPPKGDGRSRRGSSRDGWTVSVFYWPEGVAPASPGLGFALAAEGLRHDVWVRRPSGRRDHVRDAAPGRRCGGDPRPLRHGISRGADVQRVADWLPDSPTHGRQLYQMAEGKRVGKLFFWLLRSFLLSEKKRNE